MIHSGPGTWDGGLTLFNTHKGTRLRNRSPLRRISYFVSADYRSLWIGTWGSGLYHWIAETDSLAHYREDSDDRYKLNHGIVYSFLKDRSGIIWIGTNGGGHQ